VIPWYIQYGSSQRENEYKLTLGQLILNEYKINCPNLNHLKNGKTVADSLAEGLKSYQKLQLETWKSSTSSSHSLSGVSSSRTPAAAKQPFLPPRMWPQLLLHASVCRMLSPRLGRQSDKLEAPNLNTTARWVCVSCLFSTQQMLLMLLRVAVVIISHDQDGVRYPGPGPDS
jgi:hypothetical protein